MFGYTGNIELIFNFTKKPVSGQSSMPVLSLPPENRKAYFQGVKKENITRNGLTISVNFSTRGKKIHRFFTTSTEKHFSC